MVIDSTRGFSLSDIVPLFLSKEKSLVKSNHCAIIINSITKDESKRWIDVINPGVGFEWRSH